MRSTDTCRILCAAFAMATAAWTSRALAQAPADPPANVPKRFAEFPKEQRAILNEIEEAYKAPREVHEDVIGQLRKSYQKPSEARETKIFEELRRLYAMTPAQESTILAEIRKAYQQPSADQELRIFQEIAKAEALPLGTVPPSVQMRQAEKLFKGLDSNGDGVLSHNEQSDLLRAERGRWDANRDGVIDQAEFWAFYQGHLGDLSVRVARGEIKLKEGLVPQFELKTTPAAEKPRPTVVRAGKLPAGLPTWFGELDLDRDAQVGLYEWRKSGRPLAEFRAMDQNGDGFITVDELTRYLGKNSSKQMAGSSLRPAESPGRQRE